jgi:nucleoside-diphosphate-sugar epimerase
MRVACLPASEAGIVGQVNVVIVGGHGKIGMRLAKLLAERGDSPRGIIRKTEQAPDLEAIGAEPIVLDIENVDDISDALAGSDAVVFAAGAGPGSGPARKRTVDYGGAVKLADAAKAQDISRYVIVSSIGSNRTETWSDQMRPYQEAKSEADKYLVQSGLDYTILRPGGLTDDPGTGKVQLGERLEYGQVTRDDVAAVIAACLTADNSIGKACDLMNGDTPIAEAVAAL